MKIIIIGAGIAGLTLAIACHRAGMDVKLYEKTQRLQNIGGGVLLWPHGLRYLEWLGILDAIKFYLPDMRSCNIRGANGNTIKQEEYADLYSLLDGEILPIERNFLQQLLLEQLPVNILILNKKLTTIEDTANGAKIFFEDGTSDSADIVVGADGIYSQVRNSIAKENIIQYAGYCWWGGIIKKDEVSSLSSDEVLFAIHYGKVCNVWPLKSSDYMWFLPVKMPNQLLKNDKQGFAYLETICGDWHDDIVQQVIKAGKNNRYFHLPIYTVPAKQNWQAQRITLIGDAAHATGPILGQGTSLAIEDAFVLFNILKNYNQDISKAIRLYENLRFTKIQQVCDLEEKSAAMMINDNVSEVDQLLGLLPTTNLVTLYRELILLADKNSCQKVVESIANLVLV